MKMNPWAVRILGIAALTVMLSGFPGDVFGYGITNVAPVSVNNSVVYTTTYNGTLYYGVTSPSWLGNVWPGVINPAFSVGYNGAIYDDQTGAVVSDGATVPVGTVLRFVPSLGDVAVNGTGLTSDTPYGDWVPGAAFPDGPTFIFSDSGYTFRGAQCSEKYVAGYDTGIGKVYLPFSVNPVTPTVTNTGTAVLTQVGADTYQVTSPGTIQTTFTFPATYGKVYYEYSDIAYAGCHTDWNVYAMYDATTTKGTSSTDEYVLTVPAQTLSFSLTAAEGNAPNIPTLTCPSSANVGQPASFSVVGTDPGGAQIKYGIDWFSTGTVNEWVPSSGYVPSGTSQAFTHTWAATGTYTVSALAQNDQGISSGWSPSCTVTVGPATPTVHIQFQ